VINGLDPLKARRATENRPGGENRDCKWEGKGTREGEGEKVVEKVRLKGKRKGEEGGNSEF